MNPLRYKAGAKVKKIVAIAILAGVLGITSAKFYLHHQVTSNLDQAIALVKPFADIRYEGVSSTLSGALNVEGISARFGTFGDRLEIDQISLLTPGFWFLLNLGDMEKQQASSNASIPESFGLAVQGLRADVSDDFMKFFVQAAQQAAAAMVEDDAVGQCVGKYGYSVEALESLGYDEIVMSMSLGYQKVDGNLQIDLWAAMADMYAIQVDVTLDGSMTTESIARGAFRPRMITGRIEYEDQSLMARTRELCGRKGFSDEQIMAAELDAFRSAGMQSGIEFGASVLESYEKFLSDGSTFVIEANPPGPINLSQIDLYKPTDVPALLNLSTQVL